MTRQTHCPKCDAELPRKGRFCLECGLDLYEEGLRHPPGPWVPLLVVVLVVGGLIAFLASRPRGPDLPPEEQAVRERTRDVLALAAAGECKTIVDRYCEPDETRYQRTTELLREIVRGSGAPGLNVFRATCMDNFEEAVKFVERYDARHPLYMVRVLAAITFEDGALRTSLGGTAFGAQRTDLFLAWFLERVFADADPAEAEIVEAGWQTEPGGEALMVVRLRYPEPPETLPGVPSPTTLPWRRLSDGTWALAITDETNLQELLDLLRRVKL